MSFLEQFQQQYANCIKLKDLELFINKISGELPSDLGKLKQLEILALSDNEIGGDTYQIQFIRLQT